MPKEVTPRWSGLGKFPPGTCKLCLVTLLANKSDSQRTRPYRSKSLQFQCCRRTRNWGCQLPFETFSTRTSTRSSRPRFPSPMAQILSRPGAPPALDLFPFCGVCVSFRRVLIPMPLWECWSYLRLRKSEDGFGNFVSQLFSAYRLSLACRIENPDLCDEWLSLPVSSHHSEIFQMPTCLLHDAYPGHCQAPSARAQAN